MSDPNTTPPLDSGSNTNPTNSAPTTVLPGPPPAVSNRPLANPDSSLGSGSSSGTPVTGFVNQSASYRNAIIIASAVSGAIGLILVSFVVWMVYRRRNRRKAGGGPTSGNAGRPASDSSWVGPRLSPGDSFDDDKLEAGDRGSKADSVESDATLNDSEATHKKSSSFGTSTTYSPRPSMDKLRITTTPLVSRDTFNAPQMPVMPGARPSLEQPTSQGLLTPRVRRGPVLRVESNSNFNSGIVVEQADPSPDIPLITPVDTWRSPVGEYNANPFMLMATAARRDSMASLSRQSSRASSRTSPVEGAEVTSPRKKAMFFANAKKRRHSRADSIDPFRKSAVSMKVRRKSIRTSRTDTLASRGASYNTGGGVVRRRSNRSSRASRAESGPAPTTPGGRRRSRAPSVVSSRHQSQATVNEARVFSRALAPTLRGLPTDPRTPSNAAARQSTHESFTFTPRTAPPPIDISSPETPRTAPLHTPDPQTPRTPRGHARRPKAAVPRTPTSLEDAHWRAVPLPEPPMTANPTTPRPLPVPAAPKTPQSAGAVPSRPRTPQSAMALPPRTPRTARAERRLSQLSRTLSDVSHESEYMGKAF